MKGCDVKNQITSIQKLNMVNVYHLFGDQGPMIGVIAYYQDKVINLCNTDPHFAEFLDRVAKTYEKEAMSGEVVADEETKAFLRRIIDFPQHELEAKLAGFQQVDYPAMIPNIHSDDIKGFTEIRFQ